MASALSLFIGAITAAAGRSVFVLGLYDVVAALSISVSLVALVHLARWKPGAVTTVLGMLCALLWLGSFRVVDAWLFRLEQGQEVARQSPELAPEFIAAGAETPLELVDAGLAAETGAPGGRGALRVGLRGGVVVSRAFGVSRVLPAPQWAVGLGLALEAAFVALIVARALQHLAHEPVCAVCGRYLRRKSLGTCQTGEIERLAAAWAEGERAVPRISGTRSVAAAFEDTCPVGHSAQPGYAILRLRRRGLARQVPGPLADLPPKTGS